MTLDAFTETTRHAREDPRVEGAALAAGARPLLAPPVRARRRNVVERVVAPPGEIAAACLAGVGTAAATGWTHPLAALLAVALWVLAVYPREHGCLRPLQTGLSVPLRGLVAVMAVTGGLVALGLMRASSMPLVLAVTATATATSSCWRLLRARTSVATALVVTEPAAAVDLDATGRRPRLDVRAVFPVVNRDSTPTHPAAPTGSADSAGSSCAGLVAEVRRAALEERVDVVVVVPGGAVTPDLVRRLGWVLDDVGVHLLLVHAAEAASPHRLLPVTVAGRTMLTVRPSHRPVWGRAAKQLLDRGLALALLALSGPVLLAMCALVRLDSHGPAIFKQQRVGRRGEPFTMYKLRTMHTDAEAVRVSLQTQQSESMLFKMVDDPRITRAGRFLRRSSLDELPQLVNVLKGNMSLVGPRPALPEEVARYDEVARRRLDSKPGLSGLWQVSGRSDLDWQHSLALDLHYVDNSRLVDDVWILARTVHAVIASKGAY